MNCSKPDNSGNCADEPRGQTARSNSCAMNDGFSRKKADLHRRVCLDSAGLKWALRPIIQYHCPIDSRLCFGLIASVNLDARYGMFFRK
jgi:hypothetical protein